MFSAKQSNKSAEAFRNKPPKEEEVELEHPSVLHLIQGSTRGCHITSKIFGSFGGWKVISNFLRRIKSVMEREQVFELLPAKENEAVMELFQWIFLLLNLNWFLANQIEFMMLMIAAFTTSLDWWLEDLLLGYQMSSMDWKWRGIFRVHDNQHQILQA